MIYEEDCAVQYKHSTSSGLLPCNSMDVTDLCLYRCIMCPLIGAQGFCFTKGCSIYVSSLTLGVTNDVHNLELFIRVL